MDDERDVVAVSGLTDRMSSSSIGSVSVLGGWHHRLITEIAVLG